MYLKAIHAPFLVGLDVVFMISDNTYGWESVFKDLGDGFKLGPGSGLNGSLEWPLKSLKYVRPGLSFPGSLAFGLSTTLPATSVYLLASGGANVPCVRNIRAWANASAFVFLFDSSGPNERRGEANCVVGDSSRTPESLDRLFGMLIDIFIIDPTHLPLRVNTLLAQVPVMYVRHVPSGGTHIDKQFLSPVGDGDFITWASGFSADQADPSFRPLRERTVSFLCCRPPGQIMGALRL